MATRGAFSNRIGFIMAAAGSAVGLGNIWGFPYEVGQGGGAVFVLVYLFFCFTLCLPVMLTEVAIGRKTRKNAVGAFEVLGFKKWKPLGLLGIICGVLILSFYNVIAGWAVGYIYEMSTGNFGIADEFQSYTSQVSNVGSYGLVFMLVTAFVVSKGVSGGIEKVARLLMPALVVMILGVAIYAMTLPNAIAGVKFYLIPDFSKFNGSVIYNAMGQAFFSLSLGMGALITYGSYVDRNENLISSTVMITIADVGIAVLAGLMIFPLVGFMTDGSMTDASRGPELIFVTIPQIFGTIGGQAGAIIGASFFILLCFAALTSTVSLLEVPVAYLVDELNIERKKAVWYMAVIVYVVGLPSLLGNGYSEFFTEFVRYPGAESSISFLDFILNVANDSLLPLGGSLLVIFAAYIWKKENLDQEIAAGAPNYEGSLLQKYMHLATSYLIPFILGVIFILTVLITFFGLDL